MAAHLIRYEAMVSAIAECDRVDEVKDIRDKAMALEVYYKPARNTEAERRAGILLRDLARAEPSKSADACLLHTDALEAWAQRHAREAS